MRIVRWGLAFCLSGVLAVAAIEAQWVGYAGSAIRRIAPEGRAAPLSSGPAAVINDAYQTGTGTLTLLAVGDIVDCPARPGVAEKLPETADLLGLRSAFDLSDVAASQTARLAQTWPDAPVLALGDLVYRSGRAVEFSDCYNPVWGGLRDRTLPTPGNHEYKTPGAFGYYDYWQDRAGPDRRGYYATRADNWLILSLNSEVDAGPQSDQGRWLRQTLNTAPEDCVLAFYHKPAFSLQERGDREDAVLLFDQLQEAGATLVLNGHNHFYERTAPMGMYGETNYVNGTIAFTVGTGGKTSTAKPVLDTTAAAVFGSVGLLRLELSADRFRWWYHDATKDKIADTGEARCNPARQAIVAARANGDAVTVVKLR